MISIYCEIFDTATHVPNAVLCFGRAPPNIFHLPGCCQINIESCVSQGLSAAGMQQTIERIDEELVSTRREVFSRAQAAVQQGDLGTVQQLSGLAGTLMLGTPEAQLASQAAQYR